MTAEQKKISKTHPDGQLIKIEKAFVYDLDIEPILSDDPDYKIAQDARERRKNGEQVYTLEQVVNRERE